MARLKCGAVIRLRKRVDSYNDFIGFSVAVHDREQEFEVGASWGTDDGLDVTRGTYAFFNMRRDAIPGIIALLRKAYKESSTWR